MDPFIEWLLDKILWVLGAVVGWGTYVTVKLFKQSTKIAVLEKSERLAVLEKTVTDYVANLPALRMQISADMDRLGEQISSLRTEGSARAEKMYAHMNNMRLELKGDINRESDKRKS